MVVRRFIRVADECRPRAAAVISFTNRAADEVSQRCSTTGCPELAQFPHFVGTFDRFIATYIVRPFGQLGGPIRVVDSWDALEIQIAATGVNRPVSLDHFEVSPDGVLRFDRRAGDPDVQGAALERLEWVAKTRYAELRDQGYITCDDARAYALRLVQDHPQIGILIRERFAEIIVDEAQDCSSQELALLRHLNAEGVPLVIVCDPHQSIYEWRDANPAAFAAFVEGLQEIRLEGNWRSTPAICALASTLREGPPDSSVGPHAQDDRPIAVLRYGGWPTPTLGERFVELLSETGLRPSDGLILGHNANSAARAAGASVTRGQNNLATLAIASVRLADPTTEPRKRQREFDRVQRFVLRLLRINATGHTTERAAELASVRPVWLRTSTLSLVRSISALDLDTVVSDWISEVRAALVAVGASADRPTTAPGTLLPTPPNSADKTIRQFLRAQAGTFGVRHSSVHRAKGSEAPGVLVVVPRDRAPATKSADLVTAWENGDEFEAKRVLYVAVTRAERLSVLGIPDGLADRVLALLDRESVPHTIETI
jgi:hypothetical protein